MLETYKVTEENQTKFDQKLKKYVSILKSYFALLSYLEREGK